MSFNTGIPPLTTGVTAIADSIPAESTSLLNGNMTNVTKLSVNNYLMLSRQVYVLLDGYELASYLDGIPPPATHLTVNDISVPNPAFI